ncbi:MAG: glycosyltransferase family 39 protein [bacterium]|nr:glycosyltransferase family 39 protein [bacterium]
MSRWVRMSILKQNIALVVVLGLFVLLLGGLASGVSLLDDDWGHLQLSTAGFGEILTSSWVGAQGAGGYYRPVVSALLRLEFLLVGFAPLLYHITNVLIHCLCALLVYRLAQRLFPNAPPATAWTALLFFLVLPIHTDVIFWIVARTDSVCTLFYLWTCLLFIDLSQRPSAVRWAGFGLCFLLAFFSKEMAFSLPGVLVLLALHQGNGRQVHMRRALVLSCVLLVIYLGTRQVVLGGVFAGVPGRNFSVWLWARQVLRAGMMMGMTDFRFFGAVLLVATAAAFVVLDRKTNVVRDVVFLGGITLFTLVPVLGRIHRWYLYLPSVFFCLALGRVWSGRSGYFLRVRGVALGVLIFYFGWTLSREGGFWREASAVSEGVVQDVLSALSGTEQTTYLMNVPSAYSPPGSLGGKPLFAFALPNALAIRGGVSGAKTPVVVNHLWLQHHLDFRTEVSRFSHDQFRLLVTHGGFFSFHNPGDDAVYAQDGKTVQAVELARPWGQIDVHNRNEIEVRLNMKEGDRVLIYDEGRVREVVLGNVK